MINKVMIFERKIMRKICSPARTEDAYWKIKWYIVNTVLNATIYNHLTGVYIKS